MNLIALRVLGLMWMTAVFFVVPLDIGFFDKTIVLVLPPLFLVTFIGADSGQIIPDLIRRALLLKTFNMGNIFAAVLSWCGALYILMLRLTEGRFPFDSLTAFIACGLFGFSVGVAYHLLFRWGKDLRTVREMNETQLLNEAAHEKKVMREFNLITIPKCFVLKYDL